MKPSILVLVFFGILLMVLGITILGNTLTHKQSIKKCNCREYQIELEMDYYIIYDGNRVVDTLPYGDCPIDKVFAADNY
jgi:hypothetical protein